MVERPKLLDPRKDKNQGPLWDLLYVLIALVVIFLVGFILVTNRYFNVTVVGTSMEESISDGANLCAVKYTGAAERGDVVVIDVSDISHYQRGEKEVYIIKRLIGIEGDRIRLEGGKVYITYAGTDEEVELPEPYAMGETRPHGNMETEWTLQKGQIFVLGDNRAVSDDSRSVGPLQRDHIIGVAAYWNFAPAEGWDAFSAPIIRFYLDIVKFFS